MLKLKIQNNQNYSAAHDSHQNQTNSSGNATSNDLPGSSSQLISLEFTNETNSTRNDFTSSSNEYNLSSLEDIEQNNIQRPVQNDIWANAIKVSINRQSLAKTLPKHSKISDRYGNPKSFVTLGEIASVSRRQKYRKNVIATTGSETALPKLFNNKNSSYPKISQNKINPIHQRKRKSIGSFENCQEKMPNLISPVYRDNEISCKKNAFDDNLRSANNPDQSLLSPIIPVYFQNSNRKNVNDTGIQNNAAPPTKKKLQKVNRRQSTPYSTPYSKRARDSKENSQDEIFENQIAQNQQQQIQSNNKKINISDSPYKNSISYYSSFNVSTIIIIGVRFIFFKINCPQPISTC